MKYPNKRNIHNHACWPLVVRVAIMVAIDLCRRPIYGETELNQSIN